MNISWECCFNDMKEKFDDISKQLDKLIYDYNQVLEENYKLKNQPADERIRALNQKNLEKDKEIIHLKSRLENCITPQEFKEIMDWYMRHLTDACLYDGPSAFGCHKLRWEIISTGFGPIRRAICQCGAEKDFFPEW